MHYVRTFIKDAWNVEISSKMWNEVSKIKNYLEKITKKVTKILQKNVSTSWHGPSVPVILTLTSDTKITIYEKVMKNDTKLLQKHIALLKLNHYNSYKPK